MHSLPAPVEVKVGNCGKLSGVGLGYLGECGGGARGKGTARARARLEVGLTLVDHERGGVFQRVVIQPRPTHAVP